MLTFYFSKGSSALASHILLEEAGATYEAKEVSIAAGAHKEPDFRAINPKARVPALMTPQGALTENPAILRYIAATHPEAGLLPETLYDQARADALNAYLCATMHVAFAHLLRGARWTDDAAALEAMKAKVPANLADCAQLIEDHYLDGPWALGDRYSMCDAYLALVPNWLSKVGVALSDYPKLSAHHAAMMDRPATVKIRALHGL